MPPFLKERVAPKNFNEGKAWVRTCAFGVTFIDCRDRRPRLSVKPNFKNSNFPKEEFSDTSPVPKTLFYLYYNGGSKPSPYDHNLGQQLNLVGDDVLGVPLIKISLCFARAVGDACPYRFSCCLKLLPVWEGLAPPVLYLPQIRFPSCKIHTGMI